MISESPGRPELFLAVLGGRAPGCHIELHDVRFVAAATIDAALPELRRQWFGRREGLHLDAYMAVRAVDGYAVSLGREPAAPRPERLWFVNLGAYRPDSLVELHHFGLVVALSPQAAKAAAKRQWLRCALQQHKDDLVALGRLPGDRAAGADWGRCSARGSRQTDFMTASAITSVVDPRILQIAGSWDGAPRFRCASVNYRSRCLVDAAQPACGSRSAEPKAFEPPPATMNLRLSPPIGWPALR